MDKIGILSMQRIKNYGSFLQSYGLKSILEELGHNVEFVDYHVGNTIIENKMEREVKRKLKKGIEALRYDARLSHKIAYINHKRHFAQYFKILGLTEQYNYTPTLDTLVIGSDEVFNCIQKNSNVGFSPELFGKDNQAKKVITYAASFGNTTIEKITKYGKQEEIGNLLNNINQISVRDKNSGSIVENISNQKVEYHLDPVLIYDYFNKCDKIPKIEPREKYMIVYAYNGRLSKTENQHIKRFAKKENIKIYSIGGAQRCADKFVDCSPFEVLAYFKNAEFVLTDTFHGTIFSIIANKKFASLVRKSIGEEYGNEEKMTDLLERLELRERIINDIEELDELHKIDINYSKVSKILEMEREKSYNYLRRNV